MRDTDSARIIPLSGVVPARGAKPWWRRKTALAASGVALAALLLLVAWLALRRGHRQAIDSVAVLPFVNVRADANTEYLSDGITEGVINSLSRLGQLRVMARTTVFRYKGRADDAQKIGRELSVGAVLVGRLQPRGDLLTVQTELVDVASGAQLWGKVNERNAKCEMRFGWLERFLVLTALVLHSPATVGLILTAKSIARYPEFKSVRFAEYFFIGTL